MIQLVVGLGNPGARYDKTRHNIGADFLQQWAVSERLEWKEHKNLHVKTTEWWLDDRDKIIWAVPQTYMNESGRSVQALLRYYGIAPDKLLVVHDELDLPTGSVRLKMDGGHGGHNGLRDIIKHVGRGFYRLRFGIGRPIMGEEPSAFVLNRFTKEDNNKILPAQQEVLRYMPLLLRGDDQGFMHHLHTVL